MNDLVSIVIAAYKAEQYITKTIQSVLDQTYANWELIIVDDGSPYNQKEVIKPYLTDNRIRYYYQENKGVCAARNFGFKNCTGQYVNFLDADDMWYPENLSEKLNYLKLNPDKGVVHSYLEYIDETGKNLGYLCKGKEGNMLDSALLFEAYSGIIPAAMFLRRDIVEDIGDWDESLLNAEDKDFNIRIFAKYKVGLVRKVLVKYRILSGSLSRQSVLSEKSWPIIYKKATQNQLFKSISFRHKCYANLYFILARTIWKERKSVLSSGKYLVYAVIHQPFFLIVQILRLFHYRQISPKLVKIKNFIYLFIYHGK